MVDFIDAMLDIGWKNLETENKRHGDLDNKAIGLITITGVLITFLLGSVSSSSGVSGNKLLFVLTSVSFLITVFISISVLQIKHVEVLSSEILLRELGPKKPDAQIIGIVATLADMETKMSIVCNDKAKKLRYAVYFLGTSVVFLILYVISILFPFRFN